MMRCYWIAFIGLATVTYTAGWNHWFFPRDLQLVAALGLITAILGSVLLVRKRFAWRSSLVVLAIFILSQWWLIRFMILSWMWSHGGYKP
jgi:hypothetical protein